MAQPPHVDKLPSAWGGAGEGVCCRRRIICLVALYDLPLEQLESYRPARDEPADFDAFWHVTLDQARSHAKPPVFAPTEVGLRSLETFDVTFSGAEGHPIKGWLLVPRHRSGALPVVVEYLGYGGGRGFPFNWLTWSAAGYARGVESRVLLLSPPVHRRRACRWGRSAASCCGSQTGRVGRGQSRRRDIDRRQRAGTLDQRGANRRAIPFALQAGRRD